MSAPDVRAAYVAWLRELADFVEATPDLPLPDLSSVTYHPRGTDEQERAEVDRIAEVLGVDAQSTAGGAHYTATRRFGPVEYQAVAITAEHMRRYNAHMKGWRP